MARKSGEKVLNPHGNLSKLLIDGELLTGQGRHGLTDATDMSDARPQKYLFYNSRRDYPDANGIPSAIRIHFSSQRGDGSLRRNVDWYRGQCPQFSCIAGPDEIMTESSTGGCLCGAVRYTLNGRLEYIGADR